MHATTEGYLVKLVRDRVATTTGGDGTITYRPMPTDEHVMRLRAKLIEEGAEYVVQPSLRELAHVWEAVQALAEIDLGVTMDHVVYEAMRERERRGAFDHGIGMYAHHPCDET